MKQEIRKTLTRYVEVLREQGQTQVKLDRVARSSLRKLRGETRATSPLSEAKAAPVLRTTPASRTAPTGKPVTRVSPSSTVPEPAITMESIPGKTKAERMAHLRERAEVCQKCSHLVKFRQQVVFGVGNPEARLMFVGEAPGADEDKKGEPFVGRAGELLTKMIVAMGLSREEIYIANILKCRPDMPPNTPGNRKPTPEEMRTCSPYLMAQIEIIQPQVIVGLGASAVEGLLGSLGTISKIRGTFVEFRGIPFMPTFHPSYLLHNPTNETKRKVWEDLMQVMTFLGMPINEKQQGYFLTK